MAETQHWLKRYYGADFDFFNPEIIKEGKTWALVKLCRTRHKKSNGFSSIGFVLIKRNGSHSASKYICLHEGNPSKENMDQMLRVLDQEDSE